ncbi:phosphopantetheine-binding protein [Yoonia sp. BS5-3]|uniref:Phosphopantetheine-binding protein n=1 Tax=Yoonia phaeophyticola TaxID=3137369 RepID=A0ABZ2V641_9RHOB
MQITGRVKDIINVGGETIAPMDVETALECYPPFVEAETKPQFMVFARSNSELGEEVALAIANAPSDLDIAHIHQWAAQQLPDAAVPKSYVMMPALPLTATGKRRRVAFAAHFNAQLASRPIGALQSFIWQESDRAAYLLDEQNTNRAQKPSASTTSSITLDDVLLAVQGFLNLPAPIGVDTHLGDAGVNSFVAMELAVHLGNRFGCSLPNWIVSDQPSVRALHSTIAGEVAKPAIADTSFDAKRPHNEKPITRMLFLHGEGADGDLMEKSMRATHWTGRLSDRIDFTFIDAPHRCAPKLAFHPVAFEARLYGKAHYYSWGTMQTQSLAESVAHVQKALESLGPFDAIGGICNGALVAALVASQNAELELLLSMSASPLERLADGVDQLRQITAPNTIHLVSAKDEMHSVGQQLEITALCNKATVLQHDRGHAVPLLEPDLEDNLRRVTHGDLHLHRQPAVKPHAPTNTSENRATVVKYAPRVASVMGRVLKMDEPDIRDDFFNVGGDSLKAITLALQLEKEFRVDLPFELLFERPASAEKIAETIAGRLNPSTQQSVLALNNAPSSRLIFALPILSGITSGYIEIARALEDEVRVEAVRSHLLVSGRWPYSCSLDDVALDLATTIAQRSDRSEINLIGASAAGILAFETARLLVDWGFSIGCLALIDTDSTPDGNRWPIAFETFFEWGKAVSKWRRGKKYQRRTYREFHFRAQLNSWTPRPIPAARPMFFKAEQGTIDQVQIQRWRHLLNNSLELISIEGRHARFTKPDVASRIAHFINRRV